MHRVKWQSNCFISKKPTIRASRSISWNPSLLCVPSHCDGLTVIIATHCCLVPFLHATESSDIVGLSATISTMSEGQRVVYQFCREWRNCSRNWQTMEVMMWAGGDLSGKWRWIVMFINTNLYTHLCKRAYYSLTLLLRLSLYELDLSPRARYCATCRSPTFLWLSSGFARVPDAAVDRNLINFFWK